MIKDINHGHHNELNYRGSIRETGAESGKPDPLFPDGIREYSVYKAQAFQGRSIAGSMHKCALKKDFCFTVLT